MTLRIKEAELHTINIKLVDEVLVAGPDEEFSAIEVWKARRIGEFYDANTPAKANEHRQVVVVVDDPEDEKTQDRIRSKCFELFKSGTGHSGG